MSASFTETKEETFAMMMKCKQMWPIPLGKRSMVWSVLWTVSFVIHLACIMSTFALRFGSAVQLSRRATFYSSHARMIKRLASTAQPSIDPVAERNKALLAMELPTNDNNEWLRIRHSAAHVMAMAVQRLFPRVKVTIGPWIDSG